MSSGTHRFRPQDIVDAILKHPFHSHALPPGDPAREEAAYQAAFGPSADAKAKRVVEFVKECTPTVETNRTVYLSLGGGDGAEIEYAMRQGGFRHGLILEWMSAAVKVAEDRARRLATEGVGELRVVGGDAAQHHETIRRHLRGWLEAGAVDGLLVSAQAVLHELPDRADGRQYHVQKLAALYDGFTIRLFHSREPCRPWPDSGWAADIQFAIPDVRGEKLAAACHLLLGQYARYFSGVRAERIFEVGDEMVQAPGPLAVEFLHKFLRFQNPWNLRHEMQECLVSLDPEALHHQLAPTFGGMTGLIVEPTSTTSFDQAYRAYGVRARRGDAKLSPLAIPRAFATFKAFAVGVGSSTLPPNPSPRHTTHPSPPPAACPAAVTQSAPPAPTARPRKAKRKRSSRRAKRTGTGVVQTFRSATTVFGVQNIAGDQTNYY